MSNFDEKGIDRRKFLKIGGVSTLALTLGATGLPGDLLGMETPTASAKANYDRKLNFNQMGNLKLYSSMTPKTMKELTAERLN